MDVTRYRILSLFFIALLILGGYFIYASESRDSTWVANFPFQLGLDLSGGAHLVYEADVDDITDPVEKERRMDALRLLIEQRVNVLGVSEPLVQVERGGLAGEGAHRLIVELPEVTNVDEAIAAIGETPVLRFLLAPPDGPVTPGMNDVTTEDFDISMQDEDGEEVAVGGEENTGDEEEDLYAEYEFTGLDGSMLTSARFERHQTTGEPIVALRFNSEGASLFHELTREHRGRYMAIFLDGQPVSQPIIQEEIRGGEAIISGGFSRTEARDMAQRLQAGALPVNIDLVSAQTIGPTLGAEVMQAGVVAAVIGLIAVAVFLLLWYKLAGLLAVIALGLYLVIMMALFKLLPVTLTAAGIAGFILSIGMAVDANILIFERMKEELKAGKQLVDAVNDGFARAWLSIRDGNVSSMITAVILYWFGTSLVQGFALVFFIGVLVSMVTAITVTRSFLLAGGYRQGRVVSFLFGSSLSAGKGE